MWVSSEVNCGKINTWRELMEGNGCLVKSVTRLSLTISMVRVVDSSWCGVRETPSKKEMDALLLGKRGPESSSHGFSRNWQNWDPCVLLIGM